MARINTSGRVTCPNSKFCGIGYYVSERDQRPWCHMRLFTLHKAFCLTYVIQSHVFDELPISSEPENGRIDSAVSSLGI